MADDQEPVPGHPAAEGGPAVVAPRFIMWRVPSEVIISTGLEDIFISKGDKSEGALRRAVSSNHPTK